MLAKQKFFSWKAKKITPQFNSSSNINIIKQSL